MFSQRGREGPSAKSAFSRYFISLPSLSCLMPPLWQGWPSFSPDTFQSLLTTLLVATPDLCNPVPSRRERDPPKDASGSQRLLLKILLRLSTVLSIKSGLLTRTYQDLSLPRAPTSTHTCPLHSLATLGNTLPTIPWLPNSVVTCSCATPCKVSMRNPDASPCSFLFLETSIVLATSIPEVIGWCMWGAYTVPVQFPLNLACSPPTAPPNIYITYLCICNIL